MWKNSTINKHTGFNISSPKVIPPIRNGFHKIVDKSVGGDAPKDFIKVYIFGEGRKSKPTKWPAFIAKIGHKWYPNESVTEHLLTRIGESLGLNMAKSCLMRTSGQIRFLSRYFLNEKKESLVHGAEIFAGYLEDDKFLEEVENADMVQDIITFQFIHDATRAIFKKSYKGIIHDFIKMLAFDAIVGNNDRHHYNWGVIDNIFGKHVPHFSPIYDSARGLFWNYSEKQIDDHLYNATKLKKYIDGSKPMTGWDNCEELNHFELINKIACSSAEYKNTLNFISTNALTSIKILLENEFCELMSANRRIVIYDCLKLRIDEYHKSLG